MDVTPACRSLDDLARHLTDYLDEVDERPPPLDGGDAHVAARKAGRAALGAAAAAGVRHMAHRFIVGETPRAALRADPRSCGSTAPRCRSTCWARPPSPQAEADRYAARCLDALETLAAAAPRWPARPAARARLARARSRA